MVFSHLQLEDPTGANCQPVDSCVVILVQCGHVWCLTLANALGNNWLFFNLHSPWIPAAALMRWHSCCSPNGTAFMSLILAYLQYTNLITWTLAGVTTEARVSSSAHHTLATPTVPIVNSVNNSSDVKHWKKCWNVVTPLPYFKMAGNWDSTLLSAMYYVHILLLKYF